ncbi:hypothetical protein COOONC_12530 [Cooperia oncophora]
MGLEYKWMTLADARAEEAKKWEPVHVGTAAPAVCVDDSGIEVLGCMNLTNETASIGLNGKQKGAEKWPVNMCPTWWSFGRVEPSIDEVCLILLP